MCHCAQTSGGKLRQDGLCTIATCELRLRQRLAKHCADMPCRGLGSEGIYILVVGAALAQINGRYRWASKQWAEQVAGHALCVLRLTALLPPATAKRDMPNRADVNKVVKSGGGLAVSESKHDRFAMAKATTRFAPVVISTAFRRHLAPPPTPRIPLSLWKALRAFTYPDALSIGPEDAKWCDAVKAVQDAWV